MDLRRVGIETADMAEALRRGFAESAAAFCLCDAQDLIRHVNPPFLRAFIPQFDGRPAGFVETILAAAEAGRGMRLSSAAPEVFAPRVRAERRALVGSRSFAADSTDGSWWSVTDTKLSNGWILAIAQDISALKDAEARLRDAHDTALVEAHTDFLTGAPNRRHGLRRAEALWKDARTGAGLSLALLDVDHFKAINDVYGHEAGDRALVHLTRSLMLALGRDDQFCRLGGDEFMLLRPGSGGAPLDHALAAMIGGLPPFRPGDGLEELRLSVSVGVAHARPGESWPGLMHRADMALYGAKAGGRDRIALAS